MTATVGAKIQLDGAASYRSQMSALTQGSKTLSAQMKALKGSFDAETTAEQRNRAIKAQLTQQIGVQQQRIALLQGQIKTASATYGEGSQQVNKYKEQLAKAEVALQGMERELKQVDAELARSAGMTTFRQNLATAGTHLTELGAKLTSIGDKMKSVGQTATTYLTGPIVAGATLSVKAWGEVDDALDTVVTKTGAAGDALDEMQGITRDIATTIPVTFGKAGDAVGEVNTRFGLTGDELEALSVKFIEFSELNDTDVSSSVDSVSKSLTAFGQPASDASDYLDALNVVGQKTGEDVQKLSEEVYKNAASLSEMGLSAQEGAALLGTFSMAGIDSSTALMALKTAQKNAVSEGKTLNEKLTEFSALMQSGVSDTEKQQAAIELFGSKAGLAMYNAVENGGLAMDDLGNMLGDYAGNVEETYARTIDPLDKLKVVFNSIKDAGYELAVAAQDVLLPALETVAARAHEFAEWFGSLDQETKNRIVTIAGIVAAIGPVITVLGTVIGTVGKLIGAIGSVSTALSTLGIGAAAAEGGVAAAGGGMLAIAGPIAAVVAAVVAAAAAFKYLWDTNEGFRESITSSVTAIAEQAQPIFESLSGILSSVWGFIQQVATGIAAAVLPVLQALFELLFNLAEAVMPAIQGALEFLEPLISGLLSVLGPIFEAVGAFVGAVMGPLVEILGGALTIAVQFLSEVLGTLFSILGSVFDLVGSFFAGIGETVLAVLDWLGVDTEQLGQTVSDVWNGISSAISGAVDFIQNFIHEGFSWIRDTVTGIIDGVKNDIEEKFNFISENIGSIIEGIKSTFETGFNFVRDTAVNVFEGVKNAIMQPIEEAKNFCAGVVDSIAGFFSGLHIELPHIPLPHFWASGEFDLFAGKFPAIGIDWYAKAMGSGMILDQPTIFGMAGGQFLGAGEAGSETIVGTRSLMGMIRAAVEESANVQPIQVIVNAAPGMDVNELAELVADKIDDKVNRKNRAWA